MNPTHQWLRRNVPAGAEVEDTPKSPNALSKSSGAEVAAGAGAGVGAGAGASDPKPNGSASAVCCVMSEVWTGKKSILLNMRKDTAYLFGKSLPGNSIATK